MDWWAGGLVGCWTRSVSCRRRLGESSRRPTFTDGRQERACGLTGCDELGHLVAPCSQHPPALAHDPIDRIADGSLRPAIIRSTPSGPRRQEAAMGHTRWAKTTTPQSEARKTADVARLAGRQRSSDCAPGGRASAARGAP